MPLYNEPAARVKKKRTPVKILFVAKDFKNKGGFTLLEAFEKVKVECPYAELHIVGSPPLLTEQEAAARRITWTPYIPREQLLAKFPDYDVFAYPTSFDCISYVLLEAMAAGLPVATSDYPSMPEAVGFGSAGKISKVGDSDGLAQNLIELMKPDVNEQLSKMALKHFMENYSSTVVRDRLSKSYSMCFTPEAQGRFELTAGERAT